MYPPLQEIFIPELKGYGWQGVEICRDVGNVQVFDISQLQKYFEL